MTPNQIRSMEAGPELDEAIELAMRALGWARLLAFNLHRYGTQEFRDDLEAALEDAERARAALLAVMEGDHA